MLITDLLTIGNNLYNIRKAQGLTQANVAEKADLSDRAYADIERGNVTMRIDTLLKICVALHITPNDLLVADLDTTTITEQDIVERIQHCSNNEKETALKILQVYVNSLT